MTTAILQKPRGSGLPRHKIPSPRIQARTEPNQNQPKGREKKGKKKVPGQDIRTSSSARQDDAGSAPPRLQDPPAGSDGRIGRGLGAQTLRGSGFVSRLMPAGCRRRQEGETGTNYGVRSKKKSIFVVLDRE